MYKLIDLLISKGYKGYNSVYNKKTKKHEKDYKNKINGCLDRTKVMDITKKEIR